MKVARRYGLVEYANVIQDVSVLSLMIMIYIDFVLCWFEMKFKSRICYFTVVEIFYSAFFT